MNLLSDFFDDEPAPRPLRASDFASALSATNDQPIPLDLIIHLDLRLVDKTSDVALVERECQRKASLLAPDRRILGLVCSLGQLDATRGELCQQAVTAALDSFTRNRAVPAEQLLLFELAPDSRPEPLLQLGPGMEWLGILSLEGNADVACRSLTRLAMAGTALGPRASTVWLRNPAGAGGQRIEEAVLETASATQQSLYMLPLSAASGGSGTASEDLSTVGARARFATSARARGFERAAPGLYSWRPARCGTGGRTRLMRLLDRLYEADVIGIGPGACSRVDRNRFANFASIASFRDDIRDGGYGVGQGSVLDEAQVFVGNLLAKLASGKSVDTAALVQSYRQLGEDFRRNLQATLLALVRANALAHTAGSSVHLLAEHDMRFDATGWRLRELARAASAARVVSFRAP